MSYQFVLIFREKGRLNENILRLCCFFLVLWLLFVFGVKNKDSSLNSLFFNASEFIGVAFWKISFADDRSDSVLLIYLGNSLKTVFGQFELLLMYTGWLSGFLYSSYVLLHKYKVMSKKFSLCKFALIVILSPKSLKTFMTFSLLFQFLDLIKLSILNLTSSVIESFNYFETKERLSFTVSDIENFYPPISKNFVYKSHPAC